MSEDSDQSSFINMTSQIVAGYVSNHKTEVSELPSLIYLIHKSLKGAMPVGIMGLLDRGEPFVPIEESVQPDYIICLEDGKCMSMLKRHLRTAYGMTPEQYRARWNLPADYPMVAPNYAKRRSEIAKQIGLGNHKKTKRKLAA